MQYLLGVIIGVPLMRVLLLLVFVSFAAAAKFTLVSRARYVLVPRSRYTPVPEATRTAASRSKAYMPTSCERTTVCI